jgi:hypothetical protein
MRRAMTMMSVATVVLMATGLSAQEKPSFAGEWKVVADHQGMPGADLTITQSAAAVTLEYKADGQAPAKLTYKRRLASIGVRGSWRTHGRVAERLTRPFYSSSALSFPEG